MEVDLEARDSEVDSADDDSVVVDLVEKVSEEDSEDSEEVLEDLEAKDSMDKRLHRTTTFFFFLNT